MSWRHPKTGERYKRSKCCYLVQGTDRGIVYVFRYSAWRGEHHTVPLDVWRARMAGAKPINGTRKRGAK
jgi:hypothetical protein